MTGNPVLFDILAVLAAGFTLAGVLYWTVDRRVGSHYAAITGGLVFLLAFYLAYDRLPSFPPRGSTNKVFYLSLAGLIAGLVVERLPHRDRVVKAAAVLVPLAVAVWIAWPRLARGIDAQLLTLLAIGWMAGTLLLWRLWDMRASPEVPWIVLLVFALGLAPLTQLGASVGTMMLALAFAAGLGGIALWNFPTPRIAFTAPPLLGGALGLIGATDTLLLISQKINLVGLGVLLLVVFANRFLTIAKVQARLPGPASTQVVLTAVVAIPAAIAVATAFVFSPPATPY